MPGTEELLSRLQQLEQGYYGDKEAERQQKFFDTYGARFSNNRGLGLAILNELDARGIDTTAADEAVQQILDQLRTECNEIINSIKDVQEQAIESAQKVEAIANVVDQAAASNPGAEPPMPPMPPMPPAKPPVEGAEPLTPPAEGGEPPVEGAEPPVEPPAEPAAEPPMPPAKEEFTPPEQTVSDERVKRVQGILSDARAKRIKAKASVEPKQNCFKPSAGMIEAASRGY